MDKRNSFYAFIKRTHNERERIREVENAEAPKNGQIREERLSLSLSLSRGGSSIDDFFL